MHKNDPGFPGSAFHKEKTARGAQQEITHWSWLWRARLHTEKASFREEGKCSELVASFEGDYRDNLARCTGFFRGQTPEHRSKLEGGQGRGVGMSRNWVIKGVEQSISGGGAGESRVAFLMEEQLGFLEEIWRGSLTVCLKTCSALFSFFAFLSSNR